jgi:hypothetical protein
VSDIQAVRLWAVIQRRTSGPIVFGVTTSECNEGDKHCRLNRDRGGGGRGGSLVCDTGSLTSHIKKVMFSDPFLSLRRGLFKRFPDKISVRMLSLSYQSNMPSPFFAIIVTYIN